MHILLTATASSSSSASSTSSVVPLMPPAVLRVLCCLAPPCPASKVPRCLLSLYFSITCVSQMFYEIIDVPHPHPHQRFFYLFYTFLIYVLFFVPHRGTSNNSIKCELLSMSGPRLRCGVISVKMLAFLNLISCEYGASGKPQTADAQRSPRKLKSLWQ